MTFTKMRRVLAAVMIVGLLAAIPASTQVVSNEEDDATDLPMLILVNRLELTREQMETIHDTLVGVLDARGSTELRRAALEDEMIQFVGTAEELDAILEAFRDETLAEAETFRETMTAAADTIKETLSLKQGEILRDVLPQLLGRGALPTDIVAVRGAMMQGRVQGTMGFMPRVNQPGAGVENRLQEAAEQCPQAMERLGDRMGSMMSQRGGGRSGMLELRGSENASGFRCLGGRQEIARPMLQQRSGGQGLELLEQLVEVLELKLTYVE